MARPKTRGRKKSEDVKPLVSEDLIEIAVEEISFKCPIRGLVTQKVKVKRFKPIPIDQVVIVNTNDSLSEIESIDDGLEIYSTDDKESYE